MTTLSRIAVAAAATAFGIALILVAGVIRAPAPPDVEPIRMPVVDVAPAVQAGDRDRTPQGREQGPDHEGRDGRQKGSRPPAEAQAPEPREARPAPAPAPPPPPAPTTDDDDDTDDGDDDDDDTADDDGDDDDD